MSQKYNIEEVRRICMTGTEKGHIFLIPIDIGKRTITFKASYWNERGAYVAEAGTTIDETWSPAHVVAPKDLIATLTKMIYDKCGINAIAGVTELDAESLLNTLLGPS